METLGSVIDKLITVSQKIYHTEEVAHQEDASDEVVANAKRKINVLNNQRNALIEEIDTIFSGAVNTGVAPQAFRQFKEYARNRRK